MPIVDLLLAVVVAAAVLWGFRKGLSSLGLLGFVVGVVVGTRAPLVLGDSLRSDSALLVALPGALILGCLLGVLTERFGPQLGKKRKGVVRKGRGGRGRGPANAAGGALVAGCLAVVVVWMAAPIAEQADALSSPLERSTIIARLNSLLAPPGPRAALTAEASSGRKARRPARLERDPDVLAAQRSVVKIFVEHCKGWRQGSGWLVADGVIATNAHVVARGRQIHVSLRGTEIPVPGKAIWFDDVNDLALVRVPGLKGTPVLKMVRYPTTASRGATLGFPRGQRKVRPARLGYARSDQSVREDSRLPEGFRRPGPVTTFRGRVRPGSSGGPLVNGKGDVLTTVYASNSSTGGFGVHNDFTRAALREAGPPVSTGRCS